MLPARERSWPLVFADEPFVGRGTCLGLSPGRVDFIPPAQRAPGTVRIVLHSVIQSGFRQPSGERMAQLSCVKGTIEANGLVSGCRPPRFPAKALAQNALWLASNRRHTLASNWLRERCSAQLQRQRKGQIPPGISSRSAKHAGLARGYSTN